MLNKKDKPYYAAFKWDNSENNCPVAFGNTQVEVIQELERKGLNIDDYVIVDINQEDWLKSR